MKSVVDQVADEHSEEVSLRKRTVGDRGARGPRRGRARVRCRQVAEWELRRRGGGDPRGVIGAWDAGDGEAVVALMTDDGVHTCPLGRFSVADDGGAELVTAVGSMAGDDFTVISGPIVSEPEVPLEAVSIVRISGLVDVLGIARYSVAEQNGDLRIAESEYTHM